MAAPSAVRAALTAPDRSARTARMAEVMARYEASEGACLFPHLMAAGFDPAEVEAYRDDARRICEGRSISIDMVLPPGRVEGLQLAAEGLAIRARKAAGKWTAPVVADVAMGAGT